MLANQKKEAGCWLTRPEATKESVPSDLADDKTSYEGGLIKSRNPRVRSAKVCRSADLEVSKEGRTLVSGPIPIPVWKILHSRVSHNDPIPTSGADSNLLSHLTTSNGYRSPRSSQPDGVYPRDSHGMLPGPFQSDTMLRVGRHSPPGKGLFRYPTSQLPLIYTNQWSQAPRPFHVPIFLPFPHLTVTCRHRLTPANLLNHASRLGKSYGDAARRRAPQRQRPTPLCHLLDAMVNPRAHPHLRHGTPVSGPQLCPCRPTNPNQVDI